MVVAGVIKATPVRSKMGEHCLGQLVSHLVPTGIEGSSVELDQALDQVTVILKVAVELGLAFLPRAQQPPVIRS